MTALPRTPLDLLDAAVAELGDRPLLYSFETALSALEVGRLVDGIASGLVGLGVERGDRVALHMQNDPQYVVALLATWRAGAIAVPCSPMLRAGELTHHLADAGATTLIALHDLYASVGREACAEVGIERTIVTGPHDLDRHRDGGAPGPAPQRFEETVDLLRLAREGDRVIVFPESPAPDDVAVLTYTSGTTGPPKGAMNTHANIVAAANIYRGVLEVGEDDVVLGIAPLFHVTGLTGHIGLALAARAPLVLAHRFDPEVVAALIERHRATVTVAAITAYIALASSDAAGRHDLSSLRKTYSGGAPIPPAVADEVEAKLGFRIRPVYGLTETSGPTQLAPLEGPVPVHAASGALAVGRTAPRTELRILDPDGAPLPPGEPGEIALRGPQVVPGYWERPEETERAFPDGELRTGDVGIVDEDGWLYVVDRLKDMIVASGFKVWPREVEDALYAHAAVREAAVVGVPDAYRGETVWAFVSLQPDAACEPDELVAHCRERLASYKYPRHVTVLDELPKTASGKILRRALRDSVPAS